MIGKFLGISAIFGVSTLGMYSVMIRRVSNRNEPVWIPPYSVSIVMCSLNEEGFIERSLQSLNDQNVFANNPKNFERVLVDSHSEDQTAAIAKDYGWTVLQAPRGKLTARHIGMEKAQGQIIVSVDADTFYPPNWLNLVLRWFKQPDVIGVVTPRLVDPSENKVISYISTWAALIDVGPLLAGGMRAPGQSMALYKQAYFDVGGFNLGINQKNTSIKHGTAYRIFRACPHEMVREEEITFAMKLRRLGRLPVDWQAPCFTSLRRVKLVSKAAKYRKFTEERLKGERF